MPGILTGVMLAVARAAGETAPLLFTALFSNYWLELSSGEPTASLAVLIYNFSGMPFDNQIEIAWAASLVLVLIVLVFNILSRLIGAPQSLDFARPDRTRCPRSSRPTPRTVAPGRDRGSNGNGPRPIDRLPIEKLSTTATSRRCATATCRSRSNKITGFIGPSGCGKSTVLRSLNRMNDLVRGFRFEGQVQLPAARTSTPRQSTRWRSAATSAWCSSSPTRSR